MTRGLLLLLCLVAIRSAFSQWVEGAVQSEVSSRPGLIHRYLELEEKSSGQVASVELAIFTGKAMALRVIDNPDGTAELATAAPRAGCLAGVNGGYFDPNFAPIGLRIADGKIVKPAVRARLMTGMVMSTASGVQILRMNEYSPKRKAIAAVQCGPLLVDGGLPVKGLNGDRMARRTFVAVAGDRAALGLCSETSLAGVAQILAGIRLGDSGKITRALNLDGGSSSAFYFKRADGSVFSISEAKNVRDFVGVAPR
jgi:exopolysaccharide biosynthesis protein